MIEEVPLLKRHLISIRLSDTLCGQSAKKSTNYCVYDSGPQRATQHYTCCGSPEWYKFVTTNPQARICLLSLGSEKSLKICSIQLHASCTVTMVCLMVSLELIYFIVCFIYPLQYKCVLLQHIHYMVCIKNIEEHHNPYFFPAFVHSSKLTQYSEK